MASHDASNTKTTILGATPRAIPGIDGNPPEKCSFDPAFSERFFNNWGGPRAPESFVAGSMVDVQVAGPELQQFEIARRLRELGVPKPGFFQPASGCLQILRGSGTSCKSPLRREPHSKRKFPWRKATLHDFVLALFEAFPVSTRICGICNAEALFYSFAPFCGLLRSLASFCSDCF